MFVAIQDQAGCSVGVSCAQRFSLLLLLVLLWRPLLALCAAHCSCSAAAAAAAAASRRAVTEQHSYITLHILNARPG
jgi:hypothetical protein